jgi:hypothetical protein
MTRLNRPFGQIFADAAQSRNLPAMVLDFMAKKREPSVWPETEVTNLQPTNRVDTSNMSRLLNIGCGYDKRAGYLNIDMDPACEPDFLVGPNNADALPSNYFEKVLAKDVLEHIPRTQTLSALLQWAQYLKVGGRLELQTSSVYGIVDMMRQKETFEYHYGMSVCMFGSQAHAGDFHYTGFTEQTLRVHLLAAGFMPLSIKIDDGWLFHVQAIKFEDWTVEPKATDKIAALCQNALGRAPEAHHYSVFAKMPYVEAARTLYSSIERLYYIASKYEI